MEVLLERCPDFTAVVCAHDSVAIGAIQAAEAAGLRVPGDLSVTGFDGIGSAGGYGGSDTLTSIFFDRRVMGRRAMEMLDGIWNEHETEPRQEILPVKLLTRHSSGVPSHNRVLENEAR